MEIIKGSKTNLGACQFCNRKYYYVVYEIRGIFGATVRFCPRCLREAKDKGVKP